MTQYLRWLSAFFPIEKPISLVALEVVWDQAVAALAIMSTAPAAMLAGPPAKCLADCVKGLALQK